MVYGADWSQGTDKVMQQRQYGIGPLQGCQLNAFTGGKRRSTRPAQAGVIFH